MHNTYIRPLLVQARTADYALSRAFRFVVLRLVQYLEHVYSHDVE
jgi:hypothetical protein